MSLAPVNSAVISHPLGQTVQVIVLEGKERHGDQGATASVTGEFLDGPRKGEKVEKGLVEQYIIVVKDSGRAIGSQYFHHIDRAKATAEFGIFIGEPDAVGKGYGPEVLDLSLKHAREDMGLKSVSLRVIAGNEVAYRMYVLRGFEIIPELTQIRDYEGREEKIYHMELKF